ncbi:hypothetical protein J2T57_001471 [Natronocella acetinitrilica]|uniref:Uncharacterized protein n=1 Tax=Natronocella acetinitrilica TaxID=414046 RepID=A0AAE3G3H0_9GAMM|nr:hypothetical protein [Natronocella acetinitrilica]MCP1674369.1 hypothetical protein [Natronocella acetinitrilica]
MGDRQGQAATDEALRQECLRELLDGVRAGRSETWARRRIDEILSLGMSADGVLGAASYALEDKAVARLRALLQESVSMRRTATPEPSPATREAPDAPVGAVDEPATTKPSIDEPVLSGWLISLPGQAVMLLAVLALIHMLPAHRPPAITFYTDPTFFERYVIPIVYHVLLWAPLLGIAAWQRNRHGEASDWPGALGLLLSPVLLAVAYATLAEVPHNSFAETWGAVVGGALGLAALGGAHRGPAGLPGEPAPEASRGAGAPGRGWHRGGRAGRQLSRPPRHHADRLGSGVTHAEAGVGGSVISLRARNALL